MRPDTKVGQFKAMQEVTVTRGEDKSGINPYLSPCLPIIRSRNVEASTVEQLHLNSSRRLLQR